MINYLFLFLFVPINISASNNTKRYPYTAPIYSNNINYIVKSEKIEEKNLVVQLGIDDFFSSIQKSLIENAFSIFLDRALSTHIINCAYQNSYRYMPISKTFFIKQIKRALSATMINQVEIPAFVFIANYWNDNSSVGIGYINLYNDTDLPFPGQNNRHYFHIALNSDYLAHEENYHYANDIDYWAGVIGHELLHNLGYIHTKGVHGSFIYSYGKCIQNNGQEKMAVDNYNIVFDEINDIEIFKK